MALAIYHIITLLQIMGSLLHISMPQNGITSDGICALAKAFSSNPNLEVKLM